ncbi:MAG: hypothetical protein K9G40_09255 [Crocinitomicaceae bacterium]|nr:hypothetical protein [Crocinitomicaceae bacterium]
MSSHQLVQRYNQELGNPGWTTSRANFLSDLRVEFMKRQIDASVISPDGKGLNLSKDYEAFISGKKVFLKKDFPQPETHLKLEFKSDKAAKIIECYFKRTVAHSINILQLLEETDRALLLSFEHEHLQTNIDGTGIHNFLMAGFDENNKLIGVSFFNQTGTGTFAIQTQAKSVLLFHQDQFDFYAMEIARFELVF